MNEISEEYFLRNREYQNFDFDEVSDGLKDYRFFRVLQCFKDVHHLKKLVFTTINPEKSLGKDVWLFWDTSIVRIYQFKKESLFVLKILKMDKIHHEV